MPEPEEERYETSIVEIQQDLILRYKDGGIYPTHNYRLALKKFGYTFYETIGEGAYSKVKKAYCSKLEKHVAVKVIHKSRLSNEARDKFIPREIALLQKLRHNTLVSVYWYHINYNTNS